jgi:hypothetical protein
MRFVEQSIDLRMQRLGVLGISRGGQEKSENGEEADACHTNTCGIDRGSCSE